HIFLNDSHRRLINDFEETIWGKGNQNIMGFRDSQLLVGFSHNIPNNTISSFWYHADFSGKREEWNCLFKRYTQLKRNKKNTRSKQNLSVKRKSGGK
ncbi:phosphoribosyltransferase-like protein, partial [Paenibacillus ottowii]